MRFFKITFKNSLVYRWSVLFSILGSILFITTSLMLWSYLYQGDQIMVSYMIRYTIIANIITMFYPTTETSYQMGRHIYTGEFATYLIRPHNYFMMIWQKEIAALCSSLLLRGVPVILVYLPFLISNEGYHNIVVVLLAIILGHVLMLLMLTFIGFTSFVLIEVWPIVSVFNSVIRLLAGGFIPLAIMPVGLRTVAYALPFRFLYSYPLELLLGTMDTRLLYGDFAMLIFWIAVFAGLNFYMYRYGLKKMIIHGG